MGSGDETIKSNVVEALSRDSRVNTARITVDVADADVSLNGDAPTLFAIHAALQLVLSVPGVKNIHNGLKVHSPGQCLADEAIRQCAEQILHWNASLDIAGLNVRVHQGTVTLNGEVDAYWKRGRAERLILDLQGVVAVVNEVLVRPELAPDDRVIADDIRMAIARSICVGKDAIDVEVHQGRVILSGKVPSLWSKHATPHLAESILGVKSVTDRLVVSGGARG